MAFDSYYEGRCKNMKKTIIVLSLAFVMVFAFAAHAMAATCQPHQTAEGVTFLDDASNWVSTENVHGGYADTTNSCKVCHDVHENANAHLFITTVVSDGCVLCHTDGGGGTAVYTGTSAHDLLNADEIIPDVGGTNGFDDDTVIDALSCIDCHDAAPHGAGESTASGHYTLTTADDPVDFCVACHAANDGRVSGGDVGQPTHVMAAVGTSYNDFAGTPGIGAADSGATSADCVNCHTNGSADDFPHSGNYKLLADGAGQYALADVCLGCHSGVGTDY